MATKQVIFRLYPNKTQETKLHYWRKLHCLLYNAAVANRKTQDQKFGYSVDYFEQQNCLPEFKLEERVHNCQNRGYTTNRDVAAAQVMLNYARGLERTSQDAELSSATPCGSMAQLGALKRQKPYHDNSR